MKNTIFLFQALDEAAEEREELLTTFDKEIQTINAMHATREQQLMEDFEWKMREMEKEHKKLVEEKERKAGVCDPSINFFTKFSNVF